MSPIKLINSGFKFKLSKTPFNELIKLIISTDGDLYMHNKTNGKYQRQFYYVIFPKFKFIKIRIQILYNKNNHSLILG